MILASAQRNADKGDLNQEMAKGQAQALLDSLQTLDTNIQQEAEKVTGDKDQTKVDEFNNKVATLYKKVPIV